MRWSLLVPDPSVRRPQHVTQCDAVKRTVTLEPTRTSMMTSGRETPLDRQGRSNLWRDGSSGPQWAFVCEIEKLNTKSPPGAVCSPTLRNCDVGVAMLNHF